MTKSITALAGVVIIGCIASTASAQNIVSIQTGAAANTTGEVAGYVGWNATAIPRPAAGELPSCALFGMMSSTPCSTDALPSRSPVRSSPRYPVAGEWALGTVCSRVEDVIIGGDMLFAHCFEVMTPDSITPIVLDEPFVCTSDGFFSRQPCDVSYVARENRWGLVPLAESIDPQQSARIDNSQDAPR
ncbi:hypothetical protein [Gymnodinialimonas sp. 57CJ19]|uniref:hypothetical protein n=1 Tax=Gymnodinialimonas sp. 57CJ19 TaxID=3138498 RepID=UPI0031344F38